VAAITRAGVPQHLATPLAIIIALAIGAGIVLLARGSDLGWFTAALTVGTLISPVIWQHYFVLLFIPLAATQRYRDPLVWLLVLALWVSPSEGIAGAGVADPDPRISGRAAHSGSDAKASERIPAGCAPVPAAHTAVRAGAAPPVRVNALSPGMGLRIVRSLSLLVMTASDCGTEPRRPGSSSPEKALMLPPTSFQHLDSLGSTGRSTPVIAILASEGARRHRLNGLISVRA
jgi:hypothetical protein